MAADDTDSGAGAKGPDAPKKKAGREKLIVGGTFVLVILTWLIYERSKNASSTAASTATPAVSPYASSPDFAGSGAYGGGTTTPVGLAGLSPNDPEVESIQSQLSALTTAIAAIPANGTQASGASPAFSQIVADVNSAPPGTPVDGLSQQAQNAIFAQSNPSYFAPGGGLTAQGASADPALANYFAAVNASKAPPPPAKK